MTTLRVITTTTIAAPPATVFALLTDCRLPLAPPRWFGVARVPAPRACRIAGGPAGVGAERECVTSRGAIRQRITRFETDRRLAFTMIGDGVGLGRWVSTMTDEFFVKPEGAVTRLTRVTAIETGGLLERVKAWALRPIVARIHRFVFDGFRAAAETRVAAPAAA